MSRYIHFTKLKHLIFLNEESRFKRTYTLNMSKYIQFTKIKHLIFLNGGSTREYSNIYMWYFTNTIHYVAKKNQLKTVKGVIPNGF
jgi:hypothetical protein